MKFFLMFLPISRSKAKSILLVSFLLCISCSKITEFNGFNPGEDLLDKLQKGKTHKSQVKRLLGDPPFFQGKNKNIWIFFSQETQKLAFLKPRVVSRDVILLSFDKSGTLINIEQYTLKDSRIIDISSNKVVSGGRKLTTLQQIFGNIGNFSARTLN